MEKAMLIDPSRCMACRGCQVACKQWNQLPAEETSFQGTYENPPRLSANTWMRITFQEKETEKGVKWFFGNQRCMHCTDAACEISCPVGAIYHTEEGTVNIDYEKCIGCNYCVANCPFGVVSFDRKTNYPNKCTFCYDRLSDGYQPACSGACPTGAIHFGDRSEIVNLAHQRVDEMHRKGNANAHLYGMNELDGTGMLFVLEDEPSYYSLPANPEVPFKARAWSMIFKPLRVFVVLALGLGLWRNHSRTKPIKEAAKRAQEKNNTN